MFILGIAWAFGKASVFKYISDDYPKNIGAISGIVGLAGGLGGFVLPIMFGALMDLTGIRSSAFMLMYGVVWVSPDLDVLHRGPPDPGDGQPRRACAVLHALSQGGSTMAVTTTPESRLGRKGRTLTVWTPEDKAFWEREGEAVAKINLWISVPALFLAFAVWQVWSVVAVGLPGLGFKYSTNQLFWLAAAPALSGATLRIFYSFIVPLVGGRRWTAISTATLLIPAIGIGYAVQDNTTSYPTMLMLALLCGLGGGNFSSSMANISFFFPKERKGSALGVNAGLGNLGVSVVQFLSPLVITAGVFGVLGGDAQTITKAGQQVQVWTQNAAFIWVPWILLASIAAWFGMNDIADVKASFATQATIFRRSTTG